MAWWESYFGDDYGLLYNIEEQIARTPAEVDFAEGMLFLEPGIRVLDAGCGYGRHSLELARRGYRVTGADFSPTLLESARVHAKEENLEIEFLPGDLRESLPDSAFDRAVSFFTAFGYCERDEDNQAILDAIARSLVPGGWFLLDMTNPELILRRLSAQSWSERPEWDAVVLEEARHDLESGMTRARIIVHQRGERREHERAIKEYRFHDLRRMGECAGLVCERVFGDFTASPYGLNSPRCILIFRKLEE